MAPDQLTAPPPTAAQDAQTALKLKAQQDRAALPGKVSPKKKAKSKLLLIAGLTMAVLAIGTLLIVAVLKRQPRVVVSNDPRLRPSPTVIPVPTIKQEVLGEPSEYVNDPQILQLEAAINSLNAQIANDNLRESEIDPPVVEKGIRF